MNETVLAAVGSEGWMTHDPKAPATAQNSAELRAEWIRLATRHLDGAYKLAGYMLGDRAEAEDAVQEALVRAWRAWPKLREADSFGAWLDRIVANVCRDRYKARGQVRRISMDDEMDVTAADPFSATLNRDAVGRALARLSPEHRVVVVLRYWRDMPLDAIAAHLALPLGTVKSRLHYAQKLLAREIER
jgi:RNA polymerase sigma-70 factor, ECF subfamily